MDDRQTHCPVERLRRSGHWRAGAIRLALLRNGRGPAHKVVAGFEARTVSMQNSEPLPRPADAGFRAGVDDVVIVPVVAVTFVIWRALRSTFSILIDLVDFLFPILLQVMRFPLFTLRIIGDGIAALLKGIVRILPVGSARRAAWREFVTRHWTWLRQKISYRAFEEWLHHVFEVGMARVFRTCQARTPRAALLVAIGPGLG